MARATGGIVAIVWTDSENVWQYRREWHSLWLSREPERHTVMDEAEREHLAGLPDVVTIYRGVNLRSAVYGLSWSLSRERAQWFANRWGCFKRRRPIMLQSSVCKSDVAAYFDSRSEQEIVVRPGVVRRLPITTL
jgi:hypothetical protein